MFLDIVMGRKNQVGLTLSPRAVELLDELAQQMESSRAEVIEAIAQAELALHTDTPQWSFHLVPTEDKTEVSSWQQGAEAAPQPSPARHPEDHTGASQRDRSQAANGGNATGAELTQLRQEKAALQAQLDAARSQIQQLQAQAAQSPQASLPAFQQASISDQGTAATASTVDVTGQLREQIINLKATYAELLATHQAQENENQRLEKALAESRSLARLGEAQLNRWQYKTFSR